MKSNWLARIFDWNRQVIESAETPFAKLALFVLPIIAPIVPAFMTSLHVEKLMKSVFVFGGDTNIIVGRLVGAVLELLGYVGVVSFIQSVFRWMKYRQPEYLVPAFMNGIAYIFYLYLMYQINYQLGLYFETPEIMNKIVGILAFITVPTGLLAANHLSERMGKEEDDAALEKKREHELKKKALKQGINIFGGEQKVREKSQKHASDYKEKIPVMLQEHYDKTGKVLELTEITAKLKLDHAKNKGFVSTARSQWMENNKIGKRSPLEF